MTYLEAIKRVVASDFRCHPAALSAPTREEPIATARLVAIALARELTGVGKSDIAAAFGRSGSYVPKAVRAANSRASVDAAFAQRVLSLRGKCELALVGTRPPKLQRRHEPRFVPARRSTLSVLPPLELLPIEQLVASTSSL